MQVMDTSVEQILPVPMVLDGVEHHRDDRERPERPDEGKVSIFVSPTSQKNSTKLRRASSDFGDGVWKESRGGGGGWKKEGLLTPGGKHTPTA